MPSIAIAASDALAAGVPVLFLDTCSILDIIRAPERELTDCVEAAIEILNLARSRPSSWSLVIGSFVANECASHQPSVSAELTKHLEQLDKHLDFFHRTCGLLNLQFPRQLSALSASGLATGLHKLSSELLNASTILDASADARDRAYDRVVNQRRPCRKGGELKDCTIFEECLEFCRQLNAGGFSQKTVFCTSNTQDYCEPGVTPHAQIAADCADVGMTFTTSLPWALHELLHN